MYRILIVDDFHIEREIAKAAIEKARLPVVIAGEYSNAPDALKYLDRDCPDILLVDVEMPAMSGIELVKAARERQPGLRSVFFSYHNKFDYVKKAMDENAYGYILKPIDEKELVSVIAKVINDLQEDEKNRKTHQDYHMLLNEARPLMIRTYKSDLFSGRLGLNTRKIMEKAAYLGINLGDGPYVLCYLQLDIPRKEELQTVEALELHALEADTLMQDTLPEAAALTFSRIGEFEWAFVMSGALDTLASEMMNHMNQIMDKLKHAGMVSFAAISRPFDNIAVIGRILKQTEQLVSYRFNTGDGFIVFQDEISGSGPSDEEYENMLSKAVQSCIAGRPDETRAQIMEITNSWTPGIHPQLIRNTCYRLLAELQQQISEYGMSFAKIFESEKQPWEKLTRIETVKDIRQWLENILILVSDFIHEKKTEAAGKSIVEDIRTYITRNYSSGITVKDIAIHFSYNPNYLNNLYKSITGETILDYVTRYRMEEAKRLLRTSQMRVIEICGLVGYSQEAYFKTLFKRYTGLSPKEYRVLSGGARNDEAD